MNARVTAVLFAALAAVAHGHAFMTKPSPRQSGVHRDDQKPTNKAQAWFTFNTEIKAGAQTVMGYLSIYLSIYLSFYLSIYLSPSE